MAWPALDAGRLLERTGDRAPRGMTVLDRTRLTGRLGLFSGKIPAEQIVSRSGVKVISHHCAAGF